jgi:uncharacterized phage protein (TIGR02216 family)
MGAGLGLLGLAPEAFWAMTPRELDCALNARFGRRMPARAMARGDLDRLMALFPDGARSLQKG